MDVPAGVIQEEGHTGFLIHHSFCGLAPKFYLLGIFFFFFSVEKFQLPGFELTGMVEARSVNVKTTTTTTRLSTEPPGRPVYLEYYYTTVCSNTTVITVTCAVSQQLQHIVDKDNGSDALVTSITVRTHK